MTKLAIIGTIETVPGKRREVLTALQAHRARSLAEESGTVTFDILVPRDSDTRVLLYEVYEDDGALEVHRTGASLARWREETAGMIARLDVSLRGDVQGDGTSREQGR